MNSTIELLREETVRYFHYREEEWQWYEFMPVNDERMKCAFIDVWEHKLMVF